jgi:hypothetical protein
MKDYEVIAYLLAGLPTEYDSFVTSMTTKNEPLTLDDAFMYLMAYEACQLQHQIELQLHHGTSANYAGHGGRGCGRGDHGHGRYAPTQGGAPPHFFGDRRGSSSRPLARSVAK